MADSLIKPDVMLVTKNVMVPLTLPASNNKFFPNPFSSKKKTTIVKTKKYRTISKAEDIDYACRHGKDKLYEKTMSITNYLDTRSNFLTNFGDEENCDNLCSRLLAVNDNTLKKYVGIARSKRESLLSESFPMTVQRDEDRRKNSSPRSSRSLISKPKDNHVRMKKNGKSAVTDFKENDDKQPKNENNEPEVVSYKIKRKARKILKTKSSDALKPCPKIDPIDERKDEESSLEKSSEKKAAGPQDEIEIITNKINRESSANSIDELHRCISEDITSKLNALIDKEEIQLNTVEKWESKKSHIKISELNITAEKKESQPTTDNKCEIKYSWQDLENWVPPSQKKKLAESNKHSEDVRAGNSNCKIKYSWQVIGTAAQTSYDLMENFLAHEEIYQNEEIGAKNYPCSIKYSWQIIGTSTQVSFANGSKNEMENNDEYWEGKILTPGKRSLECKGLNNGLRKSAKCKILYSEGTQTFAEQSHQTDMTDCRAKYSWQNLTKSYLTDDKLA